MKRKILISIGTRPEAIKMAPLIKLLKSDSSVATFVCLTGQHKEMLNQVLEAFSIEADLNLNLMRPSQSLSEITTGIIEHLGAALDREKPSLVLVHGDTTTAFATSLSAFYRKIPVGHVEAGLRTNDIYSPWPEEANRQLVGRLAAIHFSPTKLARENLIRENVDASKIFVTGNTVIDALLMIVSRINSDPSLQQSCDSALPHLDPKKRILMVTGHRRENFGEGLKNICEALVLLANRADLEIIYPVHLNPNINEPVRQKLGHLPNVHLTAPLPYVPFVHLMNKAEILLTDSGGIQEEAPSLGKPVLVMRDVTERPEAVEAGTVKLVGTSTSLIVDSVTRLLDDPSHAAQMRKAHNPYGDGTAAEQIVKILKSTKF